LDNVTDPSVLPAKFAASANGADQQATGNKGVLPAKFAASANGADQQATENKGWCADPNGAAPAANFRSEHQGAAWRTGW
jgi:hypothetical protein